MNIFISTGEISGDIHGAALAKALLLKQPDLRLSGLGSSRMKAAGVDVLADVSSRSTIGFIEPLVHVPFFLWLWATIKRRFKKQAPDVVVLIDFQGFNLPLAKVAQALGIQTVYFIPPQEWIWGTEHGAQDVVQWSDLILSVFQKEKKFYQEKGGRVIGVGHPLVDLVKPTRTAREFRDKYGFDHDKKLVGLFPGSRQQEVTALLPAMIQMVRHLPDVQYALSVASKGIKKHISRILDEQNVFIRLIEDGHVDLLNSADVVLTSSGTTTLEATCLHKPMVVVYKLSFLSWLLARYVFQVKPKFIALPNILAETRIVPEFILNISGLENEAVQSLNVLLTDSSRWQLVADNLATGASRLGEPGAAGRAAEHILKMVKHA